MKVFKVVPLTILAVLIANELAPTAVGVRSMVTGVAGTVVGVLHQRLDGKPLVKNTNGGTGCCLGSASNRPATNGIKMTTIE